MRKISIDYFSGNIFFCFVLFSSRFFCFVAIHTDVAAAYSFIFYQSYHFLISLSAMDLWHFSLFFYFKGEKKKIAVNGERLWFSFLCPLFWVKRMSFFLTSLAINILFVFGFFCYHFNLSYFFAFFFFFIFFRPVCHLILL